MDPTTLVAIYCALVSILFLALWIYYDHRDYALFDHARRKSTFMCAKCDHLYSAGGAPITAKCPKCGHENHKLRF